MKMIDETFYFWFFSSSLKSAVSQFQGVSVLTGRVSGVQQPRAVGGDRSGRRSLGHVQTQTVLLSTF